MPLTDLLVLIVILSLVNYRVARWIVLDTMIDGTRTTAFQWLANRERLFWHKLLELLGCPYCITVWTSAAACFATRLFVGPFPMPVFVWLAVAAGSLIPWRYVDWEDD